MASFGTLLQTLRESEVNVDMFIKNNQIRTTDMIYQRLAYSPTP